MRKNSIFLIVFCISVFSIQAQIEDFVQTEYHKFGSWTKEDKKAFVFADVSNVRKSPDAKSEITGRLPIGTEVKILQVSSVNLTQNMITSPWIKVSSGNITGFVWGGTLTKGILKMDGGKILLWGLTDIKVDATTELQQTFASVRISENGILKVKNDFEVQYGSNPDEGFLTLFKAPQLPGVQNLIVFETISEACGVYASMHYLLYTGTELNFVGSGYSMGDGGVLHTSKSYVFPYPAKNSSVSQDYHYNPSEGHIFCIENDGVYDDDCIWVETSKVADFLWEGNQLVKACNM